MFVYRFSQFLGICTFILIMAGGLVTSHEAGLAVPDWPLSYGQWMPPMVGGIFWEHGHRMIAAGVGLLTVILSVLAHYSIDSKGLKSFSRILVLLVVLQGLFGGLTVIYLLPPLVSSMHAFLGQSFFVCVIVFTYLLKRGLAKETPQNLDAVTGRKLFKILRITSIFLSIQLFLGAMVRHTGHLHATITHIVFALVIVVHVLIILFRTLKQKVEDHALTGMSVFLTIIVLIQIFLGFAAWYLTQMVERVSPTLVEVIMATAHQTTGALLYAGCVLFTVMAYKRLSPKISA